MPKTPLFIRKNYKNSPFVKKLKSENDYSINQFESKSLFFTLEIEQNIAHLMKDSQPVNSSEQENV